MDAASIQAQTIRDTVAYLKTTPAVLLAGKGGGYELMLARADEIEQDVE